MRASFRAKRSTYFLGQLAGWEAIDELALMLTECVRDGTNRSFIVGTGGVQIDLLADKLKDYRGKVAVRAVIVMAGQQYMIEDGRERNELAELAWGARIELAVREAREFLPLAREQSLNRIQRALLDQYARVLGLDG